MLQLKSQPILSFGFKTTTKYGDSNMVANPDVLTLKVTCLVGNYFVYCRKLSPYLIPKMIFLSQCAILGKLLIFHYWEIIFQRKVLRAIYYCIKRLKPLR